MLWPIVCPGKRTLFRQNGHWISEWQARYFTFGVLLIWIYLLLAWTGNYSCSCHLFLTRKHMQQTPWISVGWACGRMPFLPFLSCLRKIQNEECILSDSTTLGGTGEVSSSNVIGHSSSSSSPSKEGSIVSTCIQNVASHPPGVPSSRLVAMQQQMQASGISESVARRIYSAKRPSTNNLYDYRWKSWLDWCLSREVDPFNPSVNRFGEFLISLHDRNFSPATVKGYRSAISTTLKQISKVDFSNQSILSDVVRSFELKHPRTKAHFPKWDLALGLSTLSSDLFEPLQSCGFKELTLKTVFLTALATGRRRSEIHAFCSTDVQFSNESVSLCTFPGFLAKNQLPSVVSGPVSVPCLSGQDVNPLLCPVRALRLYLDRVEPRRRGRKRLFISHLDSYDKEISCDTISRWIVQTIKLAYAVNKLDLVPVNAHEVRALASSWAWSNRVPLEDIVKAGFWASENSFISFYKLLQWQVTWPV